MIRLLVEHGADPKAADKNGATPLDAALGKLGGRGRRGEAHPDTAAVLRELTATAANSPTQ